MEERTLNCKLFSLMLVVIVFRDIQRKFDDG